MASTASSADGALAPVDYGDGIVAVDSGYVRPGLAAVHLVVEGGRAAIVDTGTNGSVGPVLACLAALGVPPERVDWVILTHVHLDHAGGAGEFMRRCPNARAAIHPRGLRHMVEPSRLWAGTVGVYGEEAATRLYGEIVPIEESRTVAATEGLTITLGARELRFLDTPGHARHHVCVVDSRTGHVFTGDTFGVSYGWMDANGRRFAFPTITPVQFDPARMHESIRRIAALRPGAVYVTHFGQVRDVERVAADLHRLTDAHAALGERVRDAGEARAALLERGVIEIALAEADRQGWGVRGEALLEAMREDLRLNAAGVAAWLDAGG